jgi:hypothetical protein
MLSHESRVHVGIGLGGPDPQTLSCLPTPGIWKFCGDLIEA